MEDSGGIFDTVGGWVSSGFDSVNGLFRNVGEIADEGTKSALNAASTAQDVIGKAQDVKTAFNGSTLTRDAAQKESAILSTYYRIYHPAFIVGGVVVGIVALAWILKR